MTCWLCELVTNIKVPTCKNGPCQACIAVADVDEEIKQAVATLRLLLAKRSDLRSEQNRVHDSLVQRLPDELKNHIFELLLPSRNNLKGDDNPIGQVIIPTAICRGWRDIAYSDPLLWSTIRIRLGTQILTPDRINFVQEWILRSRTMPLTLRLIVRTKDYGDEQLKAVIEAISQCSNRWHSLSLCISSEMLPAFQHSNIQCHNLKKLRIVFTDAWEKRIKQPVPFLNPDVSPAEIEIGGISFQSLQISWNHLFSAKIKWFSLEDIAQLFQHAMQMIYCHISSPCRGGDSSMPPVTHQRLKKLTFCSVNAGTILPSLTLPSLQEFLTTDDLVHLKFLPALVQRSSCPLTRITFLPVRGNYLNSHDFHPLPGVTDLVLEDLCETVMFGKLLFEEYFPDLCCLTLRQGTFLELWPAIFKFLDHQRRRSDAVHTGRLRKILVIESSEDHPFSVSVWRSRYERKLESLQLDISLREDGFEILIPEA